MKIPEETRRSPKIPEKGNVVVYGLLRNSITSLILDPRKNPWPPRQFDCLSLSLSLVYRPTYCYSFRRVFPPFVRGKHKFVNLSPWQVPR